MHIHSIQLKVNLANFSLVTNEATISRTLKLHAEIYMSSSCGIEISSRENGGVWLIPIHMGLIPST